MSTTTYYATSDSRTAASDLGRGLKDAFGQAQTIVRAVRDIATLAGTAQSGAMRRAFAVGGVQLPMPSLRKASSCGLPACDCPSPDLGEIRKVVEDGKEVRLRFRVRNTSRSRRTYTLSASPVSGSGGQPGGALVLTPASVDLDPDETMVVQAQFGASNYERGLDYSSTVVVSAPNCEPMRLRLTVMVERENEATHTVDLFCCCKPRVRPLNWYHHYYCDGDQREAATGQVAVPAGVNPAAAQTSLRAAGIAESGETGLTTPPAAPGEGDGPTSDDRSDQGGEG